MEKKLLRAQQLNRLKNITQAYRERAESCLLQKLVATEAYQVAETIGITISGHLEVATESIIEQAWQDKKKIYIPKTISATREMSFISYRRHDQLIKSDFGIFEPIVNGNKINNQVDLLVVPGLAYSSEQHYRVGFGGGYYDRFLKKFAGKSIVLAFSEMVFPEPIWDISQYDQKFDSLLVSES